MLHKGQPLNELLDKFLSISDVLQITDYKTDLQTSDALNENLTVLSSQLQHSIILFGESLALFSPKTIESRE